MVPWGRGTPWSTQDSILPWLTSSLYKEEKMNYHTFCEFPASKHTTKAQARSAGAGKLFALNNRAWRW